jgi:hypothetical protein
MPVLALDDVDRHSFARELDSMRVPELMGREAPPDASIDGELSLFGSRGCGGPAAASS